MKQRIRANHLVQLSAIATIALLPGMVIPAMAQIGDYPDPYDPLKLRTLELTMDSADWNTIRFDRTFDIEVPAWFSADGEPAILVSVRRKSATALPSETDPQKISMKIDINEYVSDQLWHGVKKLSLENGDDVNVVAEGFAWYLHRLATGHDNSSYSPGLAAWVRVIVNGQDLGVYVNVEQPDKQFLKNRGLYTSGETWFYKQDGGSLWELKVGEPHSPGFVTLCYSPFRVGTTEPPACDSPSDDVFVSELNMLIDMRAMLTQGAISAITSNPDALLSKGKNFYFADFLDGRKRMHAPWDLDAAFRNLSPDRSIYKTGKGPGSAFEKKIVGNPAFRPLYNEVVKSLLDGPLQQADLIDFLDQAEILLTPALQADSNSQVDGVGGYFDKLRGWVPERMANVRSQLPDNGGGGSGDGGGGGGDDTEPPSAPGNLTARPDGNRKIVIEWDSSTDNVGVAGYTLYRDGQNIATVTGSSYVDSGRKSNTLYEYFALAFDAAGNVSAPSNTDSSAGGSNKPRN